MQIVATTSLPAVDRPNADRWNAARSRQKTGGEKTDENSGHYVVCQQSTAQTTTAGTPHARANICSILFWSQNTNIAHLLRLHKS